MDLAGAGLAMDAERKRKLNMGKLSGFMLVLGSVNPGATEKRIGPPSQLFGTGRFLKTGGQIPLARAR
jgi:hypothetical protein